MLSVIVIAADEERLLAIQSLVRGSGRTRMLRSYNRYPDAPATIRLVRAVNPEVVILDYQQRAAAGELARQIYRISPRTAILAFGAGMREFPEPFATGVVQVFADLPEESDLDAALQSAVHAASGAVVDNLYTFLPAKAGSGTSTVLLATATALAGPLQKRVLVIESDLRSGVLSFVLNQYPLQSVRDLLEHKLPLDEPSFQRYVTRCHGIDFLFSDRSPVAMRPAWDDYFALLEFAKGRYDFLLADMPEVINAATSELVRRARAVFLVGTQEIPAIKLAHARVKELSYWRAEANRCALVVNRWQRQELGIPQMEALLERPVAWTFPNDGAAVSKSVNKAEPVGFDSRLGQCAIQFGRALMQPAAELPVEANANPCFWDTLRQEAYSR
ncbi:MAG: hypothetical protein JNK48_22175 [Bryobacterales bacterium]|nr:hypothetical protein [Bryobacterales bacterium]